MAERIGADLRALRKARGITLVELSAAVGRSVGWLSQIERGLGEPSVQDLGLLAARLGVNVSLFFRSASKRAEEQGIVLRAEDRIPIGSRETGLVEELLSPSLGGAFEMMQTSFFLSRQTLIASKTPGMAIWREKLFAWMLRNAESAMEFFRLPTNRVVELGSQVEI